MTLWLKKEAFIVTEARINNRIRAKEVRAIDIDGKQLGVLPLAEALRLAEQRELDLVEVAPLAVPPVCRIMDYGKYRYEQTKREKEAHKKQHGGKLKEIRIRPRIEPHDYNVKLLQAQDFLTEKNKIKLSMFFRGREIVHRNQGIELLTRFINDLKDYGAIESPMKFLGKLVLVTLGPISKHAAKPVTKDENSQNQKNNLATDEH